MSTETREQRPDDGVEEPQEDPVAEDGTGDTAGEAADGEHRSEQAEQFAEEHSETLAWLEEEFPEWAIEVAATNTRTDDRLQPIWIAHKDGHHPQSELSAAKLHTRLSEYLQREERREALMNMN